ncbi:hypothetical protein MUN35_10510 [Hafnia paralvei]|uniref:hypothetical protein n=1 Tax=Hafnia paralvei TaxID=546367 RepID=UPI001FFE967F|nr:hypothetical protein [Hafnia paralvei]MCK2180132.1 hypothetical protein [Hafnia paralvei]
MGKSRPAQFIDRLNSKQRIYPEITNGQTDKPAENKKTTSGDLKYFGVLLALSQALIECLL